MPLVRSRQKRFRERTMSQQKPPTYGRDSKSVLSALVDFGPETTPSPTPIPTNAGGPEFTQRILRLVKQLQEINKRIDDLASRY